MQERRLTRSRRDRMVAGVAGGMAEYFGVDPTLVRVGWVLAIFLAGGGLLAYIVLWIVLPEGDAGGSTDKAVRIAEERFARGEITAEELARLKEDLRRT